MKSKKAFFFTALLLFVALSALLSGFAFFPSSINLRLTRDEEEVFSRSYPCSSLSSLRIRLFYGGKPSELYENKFSGDPNAFFEYLNPDINPDIKEVFLSLYRAPQDAEVSFGKDGKFSYYEGSDGVVCEEKPILENLAKSGESEIIFRSVPPLVTTDELKKQTEKAGEFTTNYVSSGSARKHNISLAVSRLSGTTVLPGETFSFNETVGKRTKANGFAKAKVILNGEYTSGVGGGVCQVSTTLYNAWLMTGQDAVYSRSHSLKPEYVTPGLDAMVSDESDLLLLNNGNSPMYIAANANGTSLTVTVYSVPIACDVRLGSELVRTIPCDEYELIDGENDEIIKQPKNGAVYRSYREFVEGNEVICKEYLRTSTYLAQKGKKYRRNQSEISIEPTKAAHNNIR